MTEFLRRWKSKSWSEDDNRDGFEFWEQQKKEYLEQNPSHGALFDDEEVDDTDVGGEAATV